MKLLLFIILLPFLGIHGLNLNDSSLGSKCDIFGDCSQQCNVVGELATCSCQEGFTLKEDNKTCGLKDPFWTILYGDKTGIQAYSGKGKKSSAFTTRTETPIDFLTTDVRNSMVYWFESSQENQAKKTVLYATNFKNENDQPILILDSGLGNPSGIAFDWITGNVYFSDSDLNCISICAINPTRCVVRLQRDNDSEPGLLALYPNQSKMFWVEGNRKSIWSAGMDGSSPALLFTLDYEITALTVDQAGSRLYWVGNNKNQIESSKLNGGDKKRQVMGLKDNGVLQIDILGEWIFWNELKTGKIKMINNLTGINQIAVETERKDAQHGMGVIHLAKQPSRNNPCAALNCSHVCTLSVSPPGAECFCPEGMIKNGMTCEDDENEVKLLLAQGRTLYVMRSNRFGPDVFQEIPLPSQIKLINALVYNPINKKIVISDGLTKRIVEFDLKGEAYAVLVENGPHNVTSLDIDVKSRNLMWYDAGKNTIEELSFQTKTPSILMSNVADPNEFLKFSANLRHLYGYTQIYNLTRQGQGQLVQIKDKFFQVDEEERNQIKVLGKGDQLDRIITPNFSTTLQRTKGNPRIVLATMGGNVNDLEKEMEGLRCSQRIPNENVCTVCFPKGGEKCFSWCSVDFEWDGGKCFQVIQADISSYKDKEITTNIVPLSDMMASCVSQPVTLPIILGYFIIIVVGALYQKL